jgi:uncharacterized protein YciI
VPLFVVTYEHPDAAGWHAQLMPHIDYLRELLGEGVLRASGPFAGNPDRKAMLLIAAPDRAALDAIVARDPFAIHGLIANMTVAEWDPIFGAFNADSSQAGQAFATSR